LLFAVIRNDRRWKEDGNHGICPSLILKITYTPVAAGLRSTDYFDIKTVSGNTVRILCRAIGGGPNVSLSTSLVNFNDVSEGSEVMRALHLHNQSSTPAFYQFLAEANSVFRIDKLCGTINPNSSIALTIKFSPKDAINYYRRIYCLIENQGAIVGSYF
jgi:hypothetical protein